MGMYSKNILKIGFFILLIFCSVIADASKVKEKIIYTIRICLSEVRPVLQKPKCVKASGSDEIPIETLEGFTKKKNDLVGQTL